MNYRNFYRFADRSIKLLWRIRRTWKDCGFFLDCTAMHWVSMCSYPGWNVWDAGKFSSSSSSSSSSAVSLNSLNTVPSAGGPDFGRDRSGSTMSSLVRPKYSSNWSISGSSSFFVYLLCGSVTKSDSNSQKYLTFLGSTFRKTIYQDNKYEHRKDIFRNRYDPSVDSLWNEITDGSTMSGNVFLLVSKSLPWLRV